MVIIGLLSMMELAAILGAITPWFPWIGDKEECKTASLVLAGAMVFVIMFGIGR